MGKLPALRFWLMMPAVSAAVLLAPEDARAAFTVSINGTVVATDNGAGDSSPDVGIIQYVNDLLGYNFRITSTTNFSSPDVGDVTTSELRVVNLSGTSNLTIAIQEQFDRPAFISSTGILSQTFTRNLSNTLGTSGTVALTTVATSDSGGGTGTTPTITFTGPLGAAATSGSFNRTSALYTLTQTITISGMAADSGVLLTASSNVTNPVAPVPGPSPVVLLLTALPIVGLSRSRLLRRKTTA